MGYEVIPVKITKYVMTAKEIAKFFNKELKWHTYATRVPLPGEMIRVNGKTTVINDGDAHYIKDCYYVKERRKYYVLTRRKTWHTIYKVIYVQIFK